MNPQVQTELPIAPPQNFQLDILTLLIPEVCSHHFYLTNGFYRQGLPEVMMCNLEVNDSSHAYLCGIVRNFMLDVINPTSAGSRTKRILQAGEFCPFAFPATVVLPNGEEGSMVVKAAARKLTHPEEYLLLAKLYEAANAQQLDKLSVQDAAGISQVGVSIIEIADEKNFLPGQPGYNFKRTSQINQVTLH